VEKVLGNAKNLSEKKTEYIYCGQNALWNLGREEKEKERLNGDIYL
jgi:hypothetical protein